MGTGLKNILVVEQKKIGLFNNTSSSGIDCTDEAGQFRYVEYWRAIE